MLRLRLADDPAAVTAKYVPRLRGEEPTHMLVIVENDTPIGFAQWYRWDDYVADRDNYRIDAGDLGMDYAIGTLEACGRGTGTQVVSLLLGQMRAAYPPGTHVSVTPQLDNHASCRVLEKNGFTRVRTHQGVQLPGHAPEGPVAVHRRELRW